MVRLEEVWVTFEALPNYEISNYGRVINGKTGHELTPSADKNGYVRMALYHNGKRHDILLHRLIAKAFFLNYKDGCEVNHINGDKRDNTVLNLTLSARGCRVGGDKW